MKDSTKRKFKLYLTYLCLLLSFTAAKSQSLIWSDEFDGNALNEEVWSYAIGDGCDQNLCGWGNQELQTYTNQNTSVANGKLSITAKRENVNGREFTSARLLSKDKVSVKYGRIEASIKLPDMNNGLWPAFWMLGDANRWPYTGEIDIMESGFSATSTNCNEVAKANVFWRAEDAGVTGNLQYGNEDTFKYDAPAEAGKNLNEDFFVYRVHWTPDSLTSIILQTDAAGEPIESTAKTIFSIANSNTFESEFFSGDNFYLLLNLAVGGWLPFDVNAGENTPANVTALPNAGSTASMLVDYVRVYDISGVGEITLGNVEEELLSANGFGIFSDNTTTANALAFGVDAEVFTWEAEVAPAMTLETVASPYGDEAYNIVFPATQWAGIGLNSSDVLNISNYKNGSLRLKVKTSSQEPFRISAESAGGSAGVDFLAGEEKFGLVRDGAWHDVEIPLSFIISDFLRVHMPFSIGNVEFNEPATDLNIQLDEIHYSSQPASTYTKVVPALGNFGVYTESVVAELFELGTDGDLFIWSETLIASTPETYNGQDALSYTNNAKGWFGLGFTADELYDLSAFDNGYLHLAMKSSATETLEMRINVGLAAGLIKFEAGSDPYGFARDGQWHELQIPISDFEGLNTSGVLQLLSISGAGNITNLAIADIYYEYNGSNSAPIAAISTNTTSGGAPLIVNFNGAGSTDPDGDNLSYNWNFGDGSSSTAVSPAHTYTAVGQYTATLTVSDGHANNQASVTINVSQVNQCAGGITIPAKIEAENYVEMLGIQTESSSDTGGGSNVGYIDQGDWLDYLVDVPSSGSYALDLRVAGAGTDLKSIQIQKDGNTLGSIDFNATGGWQTWTTASGTLILSEGCQTIRLYAATGGININWLEFGNGQSTAVLTSIAVTPTNVTINQGQTQQYSAQGLDQNGAAMPASFTWSSTGGSIDSNGLFTGSAAGNFNVSATSGTVSSSATVTVNPVLTGKAIPGIIEAEDFDAMSGIQTEATTDAGGGINVGYIDQGDWMDYEVAVSQTGSYQVALRVAADGNAAKSVELRKDGNTLGTANFTATGGWQAWTTATTTVNLTQGNQTLRVYASSTGFNLNKLEFTSTVQTPVLTSIVILPDASSIDAGDTQQFSAQGYDQNGNAIAANYQWSTTGGSINSDGLYTGSSAGSFTVTVTSGSISDNASITVNAVSSNCTGSAANGDYSYEIGGGTSPTLTFVSGYTGVGNSLVILYYGTSPTGPYPGYGVSPNTPLTLTNVAAGQTVYFYYTYSLPEGGERNTAANPHSFVVGSSCGSARSLAQTDELGLSFIPELYPNPATHQLNIDLQDLKVDKISVVNLMGKQMSVVQIDEQRQIVLNIQSLPMGIYILQLQGANGITSHRFIKQ